LQHLLATRDPFPLAAALRRLWRRRVFTERRSLLLDSDQARQLRSLYTPRVWREVIGTPLHAEHVLCLVKPIEEAVTRLGDALWGIKPPLGEEWLRCVSPLDVACHRSRSRLRIELRVCDFRLVSWIDPYDRNPESL